MRAKRPLIRNRFEAFLEHKNVIRQKINRFAKPGLTDRSSLKNNLLDKPMIEMTTMSSLPPEWVEQYEQCQDMLRDLTEISTIRVDIEKEISTLNTRRLNTIREREEQEIDRAIYEKAEEATSVSMEVTQKIRSCDKLLKVISSCEKANYADERLCQHMCQALAISLQEKTREMRMQQRSYVDQRKKLEGSAKVSFLEIAADKALAEDYAEDMTQQLEEQLANQELDGRNEQILKLVQSIHELHQIYKELNSLVIMQGTLLDRIDFNIEEASHNVSKGKQSLKQAHQHQKSPIACRCIIGMILIVIILAIVLVVKYARKPV